MHVPEQEEKKVVLGSLSFLMLHIDVPNCKKSVNSWKEYCKENKDMI